MKSPFRIRVQGPSGEFEVFEDDPTKVAEKVRELEKLHGRTATIVDADGKPVDRLGSVGIRAPRKERRRPRTSRGTQNSDRR